MNEVVVLEGLWETIKEAFIAILPLVVYFGYFQLVYLKLPRIEAVNLIKGVVLTFIGIVLFLHGVHVGFLPIGELMGEAIVEKVGTWYVVPVGFILGVTATFAEPAVRALCEEVEKATAGYIPQIILLVTLSVGVGIAVALAMGRIILGVPLMYFLIPGYLFALITAFVTKENFVSIAFDSGGVATGPMTVTFIMAFSVGVATQIEGRDPLIEGFGMIALVALTPILAVLVLGLIYRRKEKQIEREAELEEAS